jgi:hypothetical protein
MGGRQVPEDPGHPLTGVTLKKAERLTAAAQAKVANDNRQSPLVAA